jgi:DNA primase
MDKGREGIEALMDKASAAWEHLVEGVLDETRARESAQGQRLAVERLAPVIRDLPSPEERAIFERQLAETLRMDERVLREVVRSGQRRAPAPEAAAAPVIGTPPPVTELKLLELLVLVPEARARYLGHDVENLVSDPRVVEVARAINDVADDDEGLVTGIADVGAVLSAVPPGSVRDLLMKRLAEAPGHADGVVAFEDLLKLLRRDAIRRKLEGLRHDERRAWLSKDDETALQVGIEKAKLERQLEGLRVVRD